MLQTLGETLSSCRPSLNKNVLHPVAAGTQCSEAYTPRSDICLVKLTSRSNSDLSVLLPCTAASNSEENKLISARKACACFCSTSCESKSSNQTMLPTVNGATDPVRIRKLRWIRMKLIISTSTMYRMIMMTSDEDNKFRDDVEIQNDRITDSHNSHLSIGS